MESERLRLRPLDAPDLAAVHALWTEPDIRRYLWDNRTLALEDVGEIIAESNRHRHAGPAVIPCFTHSPPGYPCVHQTKSISGVASPW